MNQTDTIKQTQTWLKTLGWYSKDIDGKWGTNSQLGLDGLVNSTLDAAKTFGVNRLAWGNKFKADEIARVKKMITNLRWPNGAMQWVMGCMAFESARSFSPAMQNGIGATGLIQIIKPTAIGMGTTTDALAKMTVLQQLEYVEKYFTPYAGRVNNLGDLYMSILWPAGVGKADDFVLWSKAKQPTTYQQNAGLDINADGTILRIECCHKVNNLMVEGFIGDNLKKF